jgi:hypothetical protein
MAKEFECEQDGFVIRGEDDDELLANVERHVADAHGAGAVTPPLCQSNHGRQRRNAPFHFPRGAVKVVLGRDDRRETATHQQPVS